MGQLLLAKRPHCGDDGRDVQCDQHGIHYDGSYSSLTVPRNVLRLTLLRPALHVWKHHEDKVREPVEDCHTRKVALMYGAYAEHEAKGSGLNDLENGLSNLQPIRPISILPNQMRCTKNERADEKRLQNSIASLPLVNADVKVGKPSVLHGTL